MDENHRPTSVRVSDPSAMRALAHPLRMKLLGILRIDGPRTVGMLADATGQAPGNVSYHLGTLAKHGFIVEVPELARDGRERWWRAAHDVTRFEPVELREDPEQYGASVEMRQAILQGYLAEQLAALDAEATLEPEWVAASYMSDAVGHLTIDDLRAFHAEIDAVNERWSERCREPREGTRPVRWILSAFPDPDRGPAPRQAPDAS